VLFNEPGDGVAAAAPAFGAQASTIWARGCVESFGASEGMGELPLLSRPSRRWRQRRSPGPRWSSRKSLLEYWKHRCPLTGVAEPALLRASHVVPWAECDGDAQRLDVYNGLLLSALWDAAFDAGRVSFSDEGDPLFHAELGETERNLLRANAAPRIVGLTTKHAGNLARHRQRAGL
jgi:HNH endonuclease